MNRIEIEAKSLHKGMWGIPMIIDKQIVLLLQTGHAMHDLHALTAGRIPIEYPQ